ncbi:hypothetical protein [Streptomyces thermolilacinus]|uniref:hypothetical protein n=1 Tax=Streptomyces thermolilacinus TaxID=285540 RepID=UPI0003C7791D|nr:hypothetical protein [Streptomyces thermolilacinus]
MIRNVIGAVLAVVGAAAAAWSAFRAWYDGRLGRHYEIDDLFGGITSSRADLWTSLFLPMAFAVLLTLVGLMLRSRLMVALAGVVVLGFTVLWMVQQGQAAGSLTVSGDQEGVGSGAGLALGGGLLLLLAAALMAGRRHGRMLGEDHDGRRGAGYAGAGAGAGAGEGRLHSRRRRRGHEQQPPDAIPGPDDPAYPGYPEDAPRRGGGHQDQRGYQDPHDQRGHQDPYGQDTRPYQTPPDRGDHPDDRRY